MNKHEISLRKHFDEKSEESDYVQFWRKDLKQLIEIASYTKIAGCEIIFTPKEQKFKLCGCDDLSIPEMGLPK